MKKLYSVLVILCWLTPSAFSQGQPQQPGAAGVLESYKIGFITNRINLSPAEAEKFWPIYRQYSGEEKQVYAVYRTDHNELAMEEALLNIRKKYSVEFLKAIPPPKINDFFKAERDFMDFVRRENIRRQQQGRRFQPVN